MNDHLIDTPNFVLLQANERIGPELLDLESGKKCSAIYGFSDKQSYEEFCKSCELALTPYPLVRGYLKNRLEAAEESILIVAIDAAGPDAPIVNASAMQVVLEALEKKSPQVAASYRITKDKSSPAYHLENIDSVTPLRIFS